MGRDEVAFAVGAVATAVTFVQVVPQIARLLRTGRTEGASSAWAAVGMTINLAWLAYVVAHELWITIPAAVVGAGSFGLVLYLMYRNGAAIQAGVIFSLVIAASCAAVQLAAGWTVLGAVLGLSNALYLGPSVVAVWRSHTPAGVSPLAWILGESEGILWGVFGWLMTDGPIMIYGATASLLSALVLLRLWMVRHRVRASLSLPA
jgi:uncharacterized protein with PQ loop repeat